MIWKVCRRPAGQGKNLDDHVSVARVRPRTSKGITDLLLPRTSYSLIGQSPSKKLYDIVKCDIYLAGRGLVR